MKLLFCLLYSPSFSKIKGPCFNQVLCPTSLRWSNGPGMFGEQGVSIWEVRSQDARSHDLSLQNLHSQPCTHYPR